MMSQITFKINGSDHQVDGENGPDMTLNEYIRDVALLTGTKYMCKEGGCGACIVAVHASLPPTFEKKIFTVNSCLVSVFSCQDWEITTVEGLGSKTKGYHTIQKRLAKFNGTQCGYCSSGWVMSMYSLQKSNNNLTDVEIEHSFAGNLCRCTGYRPILDAFKSLKVSTCGELAQEVTDMEDLHNLKSCGLNCKKACSQSCLHKKSAIEEEVDDSEDWCMLNKVNNKMIMIDCGSHKWYKVYSLAETFYAMRFQPYKIVAGNTGHGIYPQIDETSQNVIDIFNLAEIKGYEIDLNLVLGAGMTINDMMALFLKLSKEREEFFYLKDFYDHVRLVAHTQVRNIGTIAGNLCLKHLNNEFPSDLFLLFETVGAMITVVSWYKKITMTLPQFLKTDMNNRIVYNIILPPLCKNSCSVRTYKIMSRAQNTLAAVNAGFLLEFAPETTKIKRASIVYGNICKDFIHASKTENVLIGKDPYSDDTLQLALKELNKEIVTEDYPPEPSPAFRKKLALSLFYKAILSLCPEDKLDSKYSSGGKLLMRGVSKGSQMFDTDKSVWPVNQPIPKIEGLAQCSGEATFINDLPQTKNELHAVFVTADVSPGSIIESFDTSEALKIKGVIVVYTAKDIPGDNAIAPKNFPDESKEEELLCKGPVKFFGQPAAILVACEEKTATKAAKLVKIKYAFVNTNKPLLTIGDVLNSNDTEKRVHKDLEQEATETGQDVYRQIKGEFTMGSQYHFTMETHTCAVYPTEDSIDVYSSTQWIDITQAAIANCLNVSANKVNVIVRRIGGGYGCKLSRSLYVSCAAALVAHLQGKPCRFVLPLQTNMKIIGKRTPMYSKFEVGVNNEGEIQNLKIMIYSNSGCSFNENMTFEIVRYFKSCYNFKRWHMEAYSVVTDTPSNTYCRGPSSAEGVGMIEYIMQKIAFELNVDPISVRYKNLSQDDNIPPMIEQIKKYTDYDVTKAEITKFNEDNQWKKKGFEMIPLTYGLEYIGPYTATVSILHADGSVVITHGGVEMGQGLNTKAAQVCAYILGIPLEQISIKPTNTTSSPNVNSTGGSIGSECISLATMKACEILKKRLAPVKKLLGDASWTEHIQAAYSQGIDLQASYFFGNSGEVKSYKIYAVCALQVEVDILTGNHEIKRVDLLEDVGRSLSPEIDAGQIEGAFIMGLGLWTMEELLWDKSNGELLTDRTLTYKVPGVRDIPEDLRVYFRSNSRNESGVLQSKATGEPALCLSSVVVHALQNAVRSARSDAGYQDLWSKIETPCTLENIYQAIGHKIENFRLKGKK